MRTCYQFNQNQGKQSEINIFKKNKIETSCTQELNSEVHNPIFHVFIFLERNITLIPSCQNCQRSKTL